jgi:hypothetical protein
MILREPSPVINRVLSLSSAQHYRFHVLQNFRRIRPLAIAPEIARLSKGERYFVGGYAITRGPVSLVRDSANRDLGPVRHLLCVERDGVCAVTRASHEPNRKKLHGMMN